MLSETNLQGIKKMYFLETDVTGEHIRIEWNGTSNYNFQTQFCGQWMNYHCFTCYEYDNEWEAMQYALEVLLEEEAA